MALGTDNGVRPFAVVTLSEFNRLKNNENIQQQSQEQNEEEEEQQKQDIPMASMETSIEQLPVELQMVLLYCPLRSRKLAMLMLHYIASILPKITYNGISGEICIDSERIENSNLSEMFRILFTPRSCEDKAPMRDTIGLKQFLFSLSRSGLPANLIQDQKWAKYFLKCRMLN